MSQGYTAERAEKPRGLSHPPGGTGEQQCPWHMQPPPGGPGKVGEAASEKAPGSEKGPDRSTASGRAHGGSGCPAGRAKEGAHGASGEGEATRTVAGQALFPSLAETRTPLPSLPESRGVSCRGCAWSATEFSPVLHSLALMGPSRAWGLWRPIQASRGRPAPQGVWGEPRSSAPRAESRRPSLCTIGKHVDHRQGGLVEATVTRPLGAGNHTAMQIGGARVALGSQRSWGLRAASWPDSQSGVSSAALGSGLGPPSGGRGCPVAWRLRGVSMEVDHPGR